MTGLRVTYMTPHILYGERCLQAQWVPLMAVSVISTMWFE